jgi:hypothetical protein
MSMSNPPISYRAMSDPPMGDPPMGDPPTSDRDDARIAVRFAAADDAGPDEALLIEGAGSSDRPAVARFVLPIRVATHPIGCACCAPRGPVATALSRLFLARARGEVPWFHSVVAVTHSESGADAVRAALTADVVTAARFRQDA